MLRDNTLAFVGGGVMAEAMIAGLLRRELIAPDNIMVAGPRQERGEELVRRYAVKWTCDNRAAVADRDIVVLSVKPQVIPKVLPEVRGHIRSRALVLSIAAGVRVETLANGLAHAGVVRAMPNTPGQIGEGVTVWTATANVTPEQREQAQTILSAMGVEVFSEDEDDLDKATALSGTGPAYVFLFMEALIDAGVHLGFSRRVAEQLVLQTMRGATEYARQSGRHPATLRNQVTSPGGTSAEALYHLEKGGLRTVVSRAIWAAYVRSKQLGSGKKRGEDNG
jgi:pyrroline-5-carboxylate reductase